MDCGERDGFRGMRVRALLFFIVLVTLAHDGLGLDQLGSEKLLIFSQNLDKVVDNNALLEEIKSVDADVVILHGHALGSPGGFFESLVTHQYFSGHYHFSHQGFIVVARKKHITCKPAFYYEPLHRGNAPLQSFLSITCSTDKNARTGMFQLESIRKITLVGLHTITRQSKFNSEKKADQGLCELLGKHLAKRKNVVLTGNFDYYGKEGIRTCFPKFVDLKDLTAYSDCTFDATHNMIANVFQGKSSYGSCSPDKFLARHLSAYTLSSLTVYGNSMTKHKQNSKHRKREKWNYPAAHYGLLLNIQKKTENPGTKMAIKEKQRFCDSLMGTAEKVFNQVKETNALQESVENMDSKYPRIGDAFSYMKDLTNDVQFLLKILKQLFANGKRAKPALAPKPETEPSSSPSLPQLKDPVSIRSLFASKTSTSTILEPKAEGMLKDPDSISEIFGGGEKSAEKTTKPDGDANATPESSARGGGSGTDGPQGDGDDNGGKDDEDDDDDDHTIDNLQQQILERKKKQQLRNNEVNVMNTASRLGSQLQNSFW